MNKAIAMVTAASLTLTITGQLAPWGAHLGRLLVESSGVPEAALEDALSKQVGTGRRIGKQELDIAGADFLAVDAVNGVCPAYQRAKPMPKSSRTVGTTAGMDTNVSRYTTVPSITKMNAWLCRAKIRCST